MVMPKRQGRGPIPALAIGQGNPSNKTIRAIGPAHRPLIHTMPLGAPRARHGEFRAAHGRIFPIAPRGRVAVRPRAGALPETFTRGGRNAAIKPDMNRADGAGVHSLQSWGDAPRWDHVAPLALRNPRKAAKTHFPHSINPRQNPLTPRPSKTKHMINLHSS
jgi:hypothetical protein